MTLQQIEAAIPHRPPMRLIDAIVSLNHEKIVCHKAFHADEFFVQGHFPDYPIVPGVIQCECCLQAGAVLISQFEATGDDMVPVVTRMDSVKFKQMVRPGDTVEIEVTLNERVGHAFYLTGRVTVQGKLATRLDFACTATKRE